MKKTISSVMLLLLPLAFFSIPTFRSIPTVSATPTEEPWATPAVSVASTEPMPENFTTEDFLSTTNSEEDEPWEPEGDRPLYVLVFADEEEMATQHYIPYPESYAVIQLERGDEYLVTEFGIDIRILDFLEWDSNDSEDSMFGLFDELATDKGYYLHTWYDGEWWSSYVDAIIGITAQSTPADDTPAAGLASGPSQVDRGELFVLLKWQCYWMDDNLVQHEVSHLYYAPDHPEPQPPAPCCAMAYHTHPWTYIWEDGFWLIFPPAEIPCSYTSYHWCTDCYETIYMYRERYPFRTLTIYCSEGGSVYPLPGTHLYANGSILSVWAFADSSYAFDYWLLDGATVYDNPTTVTMDADHDLEAYFIWVNNPPDMPFRPWGNTSGYRNVSYTYYTRTTDPNGEDVQYQFELTGPSTNVSFTSAWYASDQTVSLDLMWETTDSPGTYYIRVRAQDIHGAWSGWSPSLAVTILNRAPNTPSTPIGGAYAYVGGNFPYTTSTTDPDGDDVVYKFDWGDGSPTTLIGWYDSGANATAYHTWSSAGTYHVKAQAADAYEGWSNWSLTLEVTVDSDAGGGGGRCPTLFVWNGSAYVDYGVIDIHNPSGEDVIQEVSVQAEDVGISSYKAVFRLREGWPGLNFSESVIDQVKLYAVDSNGDRHLCPLINATHSRLGNVWLKLIASDNYKAQMLLLETIDLTFIMPYQNVQSYIFVIEGCNQFKQ